MPALVHCTLSLKEYLEIPRAQGIMYAYDVWYLKYIYNNPLFLINHRRALGVVAFVTNILFLSLASWCSTETHLGFSLEVP